MDSLIFNILLILCCTYGVAKGGWPEKAAAILMLSAAMISFSFITNNPHPFTNIQLGVALVDIGLFSGLISIALFADRYWPMWLSSMQLVTLWTHPAFLVANERLALAYAIASTIWSYPMLLILAIGTFRARQRQKLRTA